MKLDDEKFIKDLVACMGAFSFRLKMLEEHCQISECLRESLDVLVDRVICHVDPERKIYQTKQKLQEQWVEACKKHGL